MGSELPTIIVKPDQNDTTASEARVRDARALTGLRLTWTAFWLLAALAFFVALPLYHDRLPPEAQTHQPMLSQVGISAEGYASFQTIRELLIVLPGMLFGLFLFVRKSSSQMVLLLSIAIATLATVSGEAVPQLRDGWMWLAYVLIVFSLMMSLVVILVMPDGRFYPRWSFVIVALYMIAELIVNFPPLELAKNAPVWDIWRTIRNVFFLVALGILFYRYRRYFSQAQRQQMKWVVGGITVVVLAAITVFFIRVVILPNTVGSSGLWAALFFVIIPALRIVPLLIAYTTLLFALGRFRLWEVDLYINRGMVAVSVTAILGAAFLGAVVLLQSATQMMTGTPQSNLAFVVAALLIGGLFAPTRRRLQRFVDREMYGIKVDFRKKRGPAPNETTIIPAVKVDAKKFGSYTVSHLIGRGGMGEVYKAQQPSLNREVAIKVLPASKASDIEFRQRFEREARTVGALRHPNIVQVFDFGQADDEIYMVMEYINGIGLDQYMRDFAPLPILAVRALMADIAGALDYAHDQGLVHRDVKPSNVMLSAASTSSGRTFDKRAILMDFGVARIASESNLTQTGVVVGTFDYMAPEQIMGARNVSRQADIYSLGVMLYQMVTGKLPFDSDNPGAIIFAHMQRPPPDPRDIMPAIPEPIAYAVKKAMAKDPAERFNTAGELAGAIQ